MQSTNAGFFGNNNLEIVNTYSEYNILDGFQSHEKTAVNLKINKNFWGKITGNLSISDGVKDKYHTQNNIISLLPKTMASVTLSRNNTGESLLNFTNFYNSPFNRKHYVGAIAMNSSFIISKEKPNISLQMNDRYQSQSIQGVYNLSYSFDLSSALKLTLKNQSYIAIHYGNILRRQMPDLMIVDFGGQYSKRQNTDKSYVAFQFAWKMGNYREKNYSQPNRLRFGKD
ncbi:MAG: hypothetical protein LBP63_09920 [Prevotellaceae bacterium]|jgi:hypothetical protein|nr:hypothetical protein [Prevotellaceae bacterium]